MTPIEYRDNHIKNELKDLYAQFPDLTFEQLLDLLIVVSVGHAKTEVRGNYAGMAEILQRKAGENISQT